MTTAYYGRRVTGPELDRGEMSSGGQRACVYDGIFQTLIVYRLAAWLGTESGSPKARIFLGEVTGSEPGTPGALDTYTAELTPSAPYIDITGGSTYSGDIAPRVILPSTKYTLGVTCRDGILSHSMRQAGAIGVSNKNFYDKTGLGSTVPTDPIGGSPEFNGHMSIWAEGEVNVAPATPTDLAPTGTIATVTPVVAADFADENELLPNGASWDYINQVQIQLREVGSGSLLWDRLYTATSGERTNKRSSKTYDGSALSFGDDYEYRVRHSDRAGAWSNWTAWTSFSIAGGGAVATPSSPSGKITTQTPANFVAAWSSTGGLSTNAVQIRLLSGGTIIDESPVINKAVADGANITISWAESTFSSLPWGTPFTFQIRGRDTGNVWSDYSPARAFDTNAAPSVPAFRSPPNNAVSTGRPILRAKATDPDGDAVRLFFRIKNSGGTVLQTREGTYNATSDRWEYQTTSGDLATQGTYGWDTYSYDSNLYSGEATSAGNATTSSTLSFVYSSGPSVTISQPTASQVLTSNRINVAWTVSTDQASRTIKIYRASDDQLVHQTGPNATSSLSAFITTADLHNGESYYVIVEVLDTNSLPGTSEPRYFSLSFTPPTALSNGEAYPVRLGNDVQESAVYISWAPTSYAANSFSSYDIYRLRLDDPDSPRVLLRRITNPLQTAFLDATAASGVPYEYQLEQSIISSLDVIASDAITAQAMVQFRTVMLGSVWEPETRHLELRFPIQNGEEGEWTFAQDVQFVLPTGAERSRSIRGSRKEWNPRGGFRLFTDEASTRDEKIASLKDLVEAGGTIVYRDGFGETRFVAIRNCRISRKRRFDEIELEFQEVDFVEGEAE